MRIRAQALVLATLSAAACGGVAPAGPPGPAFGVPSPAVVMTYTVAGDTVVEGRSLVNLTREGTSRSQSSGVTTGMDFEQNATGSDGTGAMSVAAAPFPMGLRMKARGWVRLGVGS